MAMNPQTQDRCQGETWTQNAWGQDGLGLCKTRGNAWGGEAGGLLGGMPRAALGRSQGGGESRTPLNLLAISSGGADVCLVLEGKFSFH